MIRRCPQQAFVDCLLELDMVCGIIKNNGISFHDNYQLTSLTWFHELLCDNMVKII